MKEKLKAKIRDIEIEEIKKVNRFRMKKGGIKLNKERREKE